MLRKKPFLSSFFQKKKRKKGKTKQQQTKQNQNIKIVLFLILLIKRMKQNKPQKNNFQRWTHRFPSSMKSAARCDTQSELQNFVSLQILERTLHLLVLQQGCLFQCQFLQSLSKLEPKTFCVQGFWKLKVRSSSIWWFVFWNECDTFFIFL